MQSALSPKDFEDFYIRLYFKVTDGNYMKAAINRAYRDFSRTLRHLPDNAEEKNSWKNVLTMELGKEINKTLVMSFRNQDIYDAWHKNTCSHIIKISDSILTIGHAQKWINMTCKYLYLFGEAKVHGITKNYQFFHIPIDSIIQEQLFKEYSISTLTMPWSQIPNYDTYIDYQKKVRTALYGRLVMDIEFLLFNKS